MPPMIPLTTLHTILSQLFSKWTLDNVFQDVGEKIKVRHMKGIFHNAQFTVESPLTG